MGPGSTAAPREGSTAASARTTSRAQIIREAPVKLNLRFKELASVMSGKSSADSGPPHTMAKLMLAHRKVS